MNINIQNIHLLHRHANVMDKQRGFTIVELLIVIVIIGILAALVIVAYTGITARANATKARTNAVAVQKKAEAYAADVGAGVYPTLTSQFTGAISALPAGVSIGTVTSANGTGTVKYETCGAGAGYKLSYWDYAATTPAITAGTITGGVTSGTCTAL